MSSSVTSSPQRPSRNKLQNDVLANLASSHCVTEDGSATLFKSKTHFAKNADKLQVRLMEPTYL